MIFVAEGRDDVWPVYISATWPLSSPAPSAGARNRPSSARRSRREREAERQREDDDQRQQPADGQHHHDPPTSVRSEVISCVKVLLQRALMPVHVVDGTAENLAVGPRVENLSGSRSNFSSTSRRMA